MGSSQKHHIPVTVKIVTDDAFGVQHLSLISLLSLQLPITLCRPRLLFGTCLTLRHAHLPLPFVCTPPYPTNEQSRALYICLLPRHPSPFSISLVASLGLPKTFHCPPRLPTFAPSGYSSHDMVRATHNTTAVAWPRRVPCECCLRLPRPQVLLRVLTLELVGRTTQPSRTIRPLPQLRPIHTSAHHERLTYIRHREAKGRMSGTIPRLSLDCGRVGDPGGGWVWMWRKARSVKKRDETGHGVGVWRKADRDLKGIEATSPRSRLKVGAVRHRGHHKHCSHAQSPCSSFAMAKQATYQRCSAELEQLLVHGDAVPGRLPVAVNAIAPSVIGSVLPKKAWQTSSWGSLAEKTYPRPITRMMASAPAPAPCPSASRGRAP